MIRPPKKQPERTLGLYLHIPFCVRKCPYCDFYSVADLGQTDRFVRALILQMEEYSVMAESHRVETVFFGGGTPSVLNRRQWDRLFQSLHRHFKIAPDAEITVEINPDSAGPKLFRKLRRLGVNRLSIGAQSFDDGLLKRIGRLHNAGQAKQAVADARRAGIHNINLDLMFGLPDQTPQLFFDSLRQAFELEVAHLSSYGLRVEEDTPFGRQGAELSLPDDDTWAQEYLEMVRLMHEAGYYQYEVSNFCLPGMAGRHNLKYWTMQEYLGLGPAAHSYFGNRRFGFVADLERYCRAMEGGGGDIVTDLFEVAPADALADTIMLSLRLTKGIDTEEFQRLFRRDFARMMNGKLDKYIDSGHLVQEGTRYRLTPQGFCLSNTILADLIDFDCDGEPLPGMAGQFAVL